MATPTQFMLTNKELLALLIRHAGVHEGRWLLSMTFGYGPGNFGPTPESVSPGVVVAVNQVGIQREPADGPPIPDGMVLDASQVNPPSKGSEPERPTGAGRRKRAATT